MALALTTFTGPDISVRLRERSFRLCLAVWVIISLIALGFQFVSFEPVVQRSIELVQGEGEGSVQLSQGLDRLGITARTFGYLGLTGNIIQIAVTWVISFVILVRRKPDDWFAAWVALVLVSQIGQYYPPEIDEVAGGSLFWAIAVRAMTVIGITGFFLMPFVFPTGTFAPRWMALAGAYVALGGAMFIIAPNWDAPALVAVDNSPLDEIALVLAAIASLIYRYRRLATPIERQQMKWVAVGLAIAVPAFFIGDFLIRRIDDTPHGVLAYFGFSSAMSFAGVIVPVTLAFAILRYCLFDIDVFISRLLIYSLLTCLVIGVYALIVLGIGSLVGNRSSLLLSVIATGAIAVLFQPAKQRVQRFIDRRFFGDRGNPWAVAAKLGQELEHVAAPEYMLPAVAESLTSSLRLPYAAIVLNDHGRPVVAAASGSWTREIESFPLTFQGEQLGRLEVALRAPGEELSEGDRRLLTELSRQIGMAAHGVRAAAALQHAHQRLVTTREEERRRLRRDLHDGLGARLAGLSMQASAIRSVAPTNPDQAAAMAGELATELRQAIGEIRRLVQGLRPPALDELGLLGALREHAATLTAGPDSVEIAVDAPDPLPPLPAAVEVALYRIVEEALTNVVRHSEATRCRISLHIEDAVRLTIADNGKGMMQNHWGVGFASMRERAEELGGRLSIDRGLDERGVAVNVSIPWAVSQEDDGKLGHPA